jgi:heme-degrading monooxygenase HmoA
VTAHLGRDDRSRPEAREDRAMIAKTNRFVLDPAAAPDVVADFVRNGEGMADQPGCVAWYLLAPDDPDQPHMVISLWESEELYQQWVGSAHFRQSHANIADVQAAMRGPATVESFTVAAS